MIAVLKRELLLFFGSFLAYGVATVFVVLNGLFLWIFEGSYNVIEIGQASLSPFFKLAPWIFMFLVPSLTMKSISEDFQLGTFTWLLSKPISLFQILIAKFLAIYTVIILCLLAIFPYYLSLLRLSIPEGNFDTGVLFSSILGIMLVVMVMIALGIFASSITRNLIGAYMIGVLMCFFMFQGMESLASYKLFGSADYIIQTLGLSYPYNNFVKGVIELKFLLYLILLTALFFSLGYHFFEKRKRNF